MLTYDENELISKKIINTFFKKKEKNVPDEKNPPSHFKRNLAIGIAIFIAISVIIALSVSVIILYNRTNNLVITQIVPPPVKFAPGDLIKDGKLNRQLIEKAYFDGDAKEKSEYLDTSIKLVNLGEHGRASLVLEFKEPLDFEEKNILINARSGGGLKKIDLILKDTGNRFYEFSDMYFSTNWSLKHVFLNPRRRFDLKNTTLLKLEFGHYTAGNKKGSVIFVKDINLRGVK